MEFTGTPDDFSRFSWTLEGPLPRPENLTIEIKSPLLDFLDFLGKLVPLQLPTDIPLRTLYVKNVTLSCSPRYLTGVRGLLVLETDLGSTTRVTCTTRVSSPSNWHNLDRAYTIEPYVSWTDGS